MKLFLLPFFLISCSFANILQEAIDKALPYSTIKLSNASYIGNIHINKPISLIGNGKKVIIKGDLSTSVITINSSNVTLKNLIITDSGTRIDKINAAISINKALHVEVDNCKLLNSLYGIDLDMVSDSKFTNNYITSKNADMNFRGNALKLYYSHNNIFKNNTIEYSKDITLNYSNNNIFNNNTFKHNRFASHLSISHKNKFINNTYKYNSVSIMLMGAKDTNISHNIIQSSNGAAGIGVVIGMVSNLVLEYNTLKYNAKAIYIEGLEKRKGMKRIITHNNIIYNAEAFHFHASIKDNTITHNNIYGNIDDVVKDIQNNFSSSNIVEYNYWDRYAGFDRNQDNIGDTPHEMYQYADQLWHYNNKIKFFYASPIMTLMNFLSNLAPFIEPNLLLVDEKPIFKLSLK